MDEEATPTGVGFVYEVEHSRKGRFTLAVTKSTPEWITGIIVAGRAHYTGVENNMLGRGRENEEITIRRLLCNSITPLGTFDEYVENLGRADDNQE